MVLSLKWPNQLDVHRERTNQSFRFGRILNVFILNGSLMVGKIFNLLGQLFNSIGKILFAVNVQISNKHLVTLVPTQ